MGVDLYLPVERKTVVHAKTKKKIERFFPLLPGYAFVSNVADIPSLEQAVGVFQIMRYGIGLPPVEVPQSDIKRLMEAEAAISEEYERTKRLSKLDKKSMLQLYPAGGKFTVTSGYLEGQKGIVKASTGRKTIESMMQVLGGYVKVEIDVDDIAMEAAE